MFKKLVLLTVILLALLVVMSPALLTSGNILSDNAPAVTCNVNNIWGATGSCK